MARALPRAWYKGHRSPCCDRRCTPAAVKMCSRSHVTSTECASAARPVPERGTESTVVPLLISVRLPFTVPAVAGLNTTGTVTLWPGFRLMGVVMPTVNPGPTILSCVMLTATVPVLVIFTVRVIALFSACVPKPRLLGVAERLGDPATGVGVGLGLGLGVGLGEPLLTVFLPPPQPIAITAKIIKTRKRPACIVGVCSVAHRNSSFGELQTPTLASVPMLSHHFIISTCAPQSDKCLARESFDHALTTCMVH